MNLRCALPFLLTLFAMSTAHGAPESTLVTDAIADHVLVRDGQFTAHVVRYKQGTPRVLLALPGGNAGALVEFAPPASLGALQATHLGTGPGGEGTRLVAEVVIGTNQVTLGEVRVGSLRELRRQLAGHGISHETDIVSAFEEAVGKLSEEQRAELEQAGLFVTQPRDSLSPNWRAGTVGDRRTVGQVRPEFLGDREYRLVLSLPANCQALGGRQLRLSCPADTTIPLRIELTTPDSPLTPLAPDELLHDQARAYLSSQELKAAGPEVVSLLDRAQKSLSFLGYKEKLLAGSFRYLTYFGRDTLLAARMLYPVAGEALLDAALGSVCDRLSDDGRVAHEEALGNEAILEHMARFAELIDIQRADEAMREIKAYGEPVLDYKMVDDDFLLAPLVRDLLTVPHPTLDDEARVRLLKGPDGKRAACIARNLEYVLLMASAEDLLPNGIPLAEGTNVGNWRDSESGLAGGRYPGDVNAFLVPGALVAAGEILQHPLAEAAGIKALASPREFASVKHAIDDPNWLDTLLRHYEQVSGKYRTVRHLPHLRSAVKSFLAARDASSRAYFEKLEVEPGCDLATFGRGHCYPAELAAGLPIVALSLDSSGDAIPIINSDGVFALFDNPLPMDQLEAVLKAFVYPYPLGLWTDVGPVVANAAAAGNPKWLDMFDNRRYHGAVVWGWVVGMLELGFQRQQAYLQELNGECGAACDEVELLTRRLAELRRRIPALAANELWTWQVHSTGLAPVAFGVQAGHDTQSNPLQLWSTVWLSVYYSTAK